MDATLRSHCTVYEYGVQFKQNFMSPLPLWIIIKYKKTRIFRDAAISDWHLADYCVDVRTTFFEGWIHP